ncbi:MAG: TetR/AcrR family transcriptional regulator [Microbacterium sp.]|nr:MAG: TetR/AcrR family transcriptional regulator [Microbacterium sp.]
MSDDVELPRALALAWGVAATPQRGPKREMSVEKIVEAAMEIADAEGLSGVSMAAVAAKLGYTPMSLYRYVSAKDDLLLLMQEEAAGLPPEELSAIDDWRAGLEALAARQIQIYLAHPWLLDVPISGAPATPSSAAWMDTGLRLLGRTPLDHAERLAVVLLVTGHARWTGLVLTGYARTQRESGGSEADVARGEDELFRALISADAYPALRAAIDAGVMTSELDSFAFILRRSLDGVAAYIEARAAGGAADLPTWSERDDADIAGDRRYRDAQKAVRAAERALREARRAERQAGREARARLGTRA